MKDAIEVALNKMAKDKGDEPSKKIPDGFYEFANSPQYRELLEAMLDYNRVCSNITSSLILLYFVGTIPIGKQAAGPRARGKTTRATYSPGAAIGEKETVREGKENG